MNNVTNFSPSESASPGMISETSYLIVLSFGVLVVVLTISFSCYLFGVWLLSMPTTSDLSRERASPIATTASAGITTGLDESVLATYPKLLYSQVKQRYSGSNLTAGSSCCSICLADYKDDETVLLLPDCAHFFHLNCVNQWLRVHPSCPMCRNSPVRVSQLVPTCLPIPEGSGIRQNVVSDDVV